MPPPSPFETFVVSTRLDYQPLSAKGARVLPPNSQLVCVALALSISTNKKSSCLNGGGCINYVSLSSKEVVRYEERSC